MGDGVAQIVVADLANRVVDFDAGVTGEGCHFGGGVALDGADEPIGMGQDGHAAIGHDAIDDGLGVCFDPAGVIGNADAQDMAGRGRVFATGRWRSTRRAGR